MRANPCRSVGESAVKVPIALLCLSGRRVLLGLQTLGCALYLVNAFSPIAAHPTVFRRRFRSAWAFDDFRKFLDRIRFVAAGLNPERRPVPEKRRRVRMPDENGYDSLVGIRPSALKGALPFAVLPIPHNVAGSHHDHVELGLVERSLDLVVPALAGTDVLEIAPGGYTLSLQRASQPLRQLLGVG